MSGGTIAEDLAEEVADMFGRRGVRVRLLANDLYATAIDVRRVGSWLHLSCRVHALRLLSVGLWTTGGAVHTYWLLGAAIRTMVP